MNVNIRQEEKSDYQDVFDLINEAFSQEKFSDQSEQFLVERLRNSDAFIPELSLVAEKGNEIVGHIMLSKIQIENEFNSYDSLALAPVSVMPRYQKMGIGALLIKRSHEIARELGYKSIILIGHAKYYPRFGYKPAKEFKINLPFDAPDENCMAIELVEDGLKGVNGIVEYPPEFAH